MRLDFELKGAVNRDREAAGKLPEAQRRAWLKAVAEQHGLSIKGGTIQLPDIQIEYETAEGTLAHANIELVSENYRGDAIRSKAGAGFKVYARVGDSNRVKTRFAGLPALSRRFCRYEPRPQAHRDPRRFWLFKRGIAFLDLVTAHSGYFGAKPILGLHGPKEGSRPERVHGQTHRSNTPVFTPIAMLQGFITSSHGSSTRPWAAIMFAREESMRSNTSERGSSLWISCSRINRASSLKERTRRFRF